MKLRGIIVGDNFYQSPRTAISRANGAHRIATLLRKENIDVEVIDFINSWSTEDILKLIGSIDHLDFIGLSTGLGQLNSDIINLLINEAISRWPSAKIIAGGNDVLQNNFKKIDLYFLGFAEGVVPSLIKYLKTGKFDPFKINLTNINGEKKIVDCNKHFLSYDLSNLKISYTKQDFISKLETLTLETSRGCIFKCEFCNFPFTGKKKNEYIRNKDDIKSEIVENYNNYGTTRYLITDDTFNDNNIKVDMMYEISQEIDFKLDFMCYARVDLLKQKNQLEKMVKFGVKGMYFGIESLRPATAKKIGKGFTGEKLKNYLLEIKNTYPDLHITTSWITGLPEESIQEFDENLEWIVSNKVTDSIKIMSLLIPKDNSANYISPFTKSWPNHGYTEMSLSEIDNFLDENKTISSYIYGAPLVNHLKHHIPWRNEHMNFLQAHKYSLELAGKYKDHISVSGWFAFGHSFYTDDLQKVLHTKKLAYDWQKQQKLADDFVKNYKKMKLYSFIEQKQIVI